MRWKKLGVVWRPEGTRWWARQYATCPTPLLLEDGVLRLYIQSRDEKNVGRIGYVDVDPQNPLRVLGAAEQPVLDIGQPGAFDDNGVFPTSVVKKPDGGLFLYYVGFELCHHIRYRMFTGLALSEDGGDSFHRIQSTPILDRLPEELFIRGGSFVLPANDGGFDMWYVSGNKWEEIEGKMMPVYELRHIESQDGVHWQGEGKVVMPLNREREHGFGRPYVIRDSAGYRMFYSIRKKQPRAYRMGFAVSRDGMTWERRDEEMGLDVSPAGWDSESVEYAAVVGVGDKVWCFYNGNDFGATGFGLAELLP